MTFVKGTSTDYLDLLTQLVQVATSRHLATISPTAGGSGYEVGEILNIDNTGSTRTHDAQIEVLTVDGGGAVLTARVYRGGAYTVDPTDITAAATTTTNTLAGGAAVASANGTGATFDLTFADTGWQVRRRTKKAVSAVVVSGGTGYTNGATVTLNPAGSVKGSAGQNAQFTITAAAGVVSALAVVGATDGNYEEPPSNNNSPTGGAGSGLSVTVTYADDTGSDQVLVLEGEGFGADEEILVGIRTFNETDASGSNTVRNWQLFGMASWNAALPLHQQSGISPGFNADGTIHSTIGAFFTCKPSTAFNLTFWLSVTPRRIVLKTRQEDATHVFYPSLTIGHLNQTGTTSEQPYPLWIQGCTSRRNAWYVDTQIGRISGLTDCFNVTGRTGPAFFRINGTWQDFANADVADGVSPTRSGKSDYGVWPIFRPLASAGLAAEDIVVSVPTSTLGLIFGDSSGSGGMLPDDGIPPGSQSATLTPTPGTVASRVLLPATVVATDASPLVRDIYGEIEGVFWLTQDGSPTLNSEGTFLDASTPPRRFSAFQNGNRTANTSYCAIAED
jgi:hypothetical protein